MKIDLFKHFIYLPEIGIFIRNNVPLRSRIKAGERVGSLCKLGYRQIYISGKCYYEHRLACLWMTGNFPSAGFDVDHINGIKDDNRWSNLRVCSRAENSWNSKSHTDKESSSMKGVSLTKNGKKWRARISKSGNNIYLGIFDTKEQAYEAYYNAAEKEFGEFVYQHKHGN